jgi:hypothetical protein
MQQETYRQHGLKTDVRNEYWRYGEYELAGHGEQTDGKCGTFNKFMGCLNLEAHNKCSLVYRGLKERFCFC